MVRPAVCENGAKTHVSRLCINTLAGVAATTLASAEMKSTQNFGGSSILDYYLTYY